MSFCQDKEQGHKAISSPPSYYVVSRCNNLAGSVRYFQQEKPNNRSLPTRHNVRCNTSHRPKPGGFWRNEARKQILRVLLRFEEGSDFGQYYGYSVSHPLLYCSCYSCPQILTIIFALQIQLYVLHCADALYRCDNWVADCSMDREPDLECCNNIGGCLLQWHCCIE